MKFFPGCLLHVAGGGELNAVIAAQGEGVGMLAGQFHQWLGDLDDGIAWPVGAQTGADGLDRFGVGRILAGATVPP